MSEFRATSFELGEKNHVALQRRPRRAVRSRLGLRGKRATISLVTRNSQLATPHAFTLIELLVVITIIATLSAAFLGVSNAAMESSRDARTKTIIGKINTLLMEKWASYSTRRVDLSENLLKSINAMPTSTPLERKLKGRRLAVERLRATRELMKFEMPDRWSDITGGRVLDIMPFAADNQFRRPIYIASRPGITNLYLRRYRSLLTTGNKKADSEKIASNQGAECLYLVIMLSTGDGEARSLFSENNIGDTDGDGALEFLDGWGQPISWLRWPVGFVSDVMPLSPEKLAVSPSLKNPLIDARYNNADHDPFDPFRIDSRAFRITPLLFSKGADGIFDIATFLDYVVGVDPYVEIQEEGGTPALDAQGNYQFLGKQRDGNDDGEDNSIDNIHNHVLDN